MTYLSKIKKMKRVLMEKLNAWRTGARRKPLLLMGVRQVGKTYLLQAFGGTFFPTYHLINFEKEPALSRIFEPDLNPKRILEELSFHLGKSIDPSQDLLIFDEIQACPLALTSLKYFQEDMPTLALCAAGSLLGVHLAPVSFPVGKVDMMTLHPMSFEEFLMAIDDQKGLHALKLLHLSQSVPEIVHEHLWNQLKRYFIVGGLPEAVATYQQNKTDPFTAFALVREKQDQLVKGYYADMAKHSGKVNAMHIDRVFRAVPAQLDNGQEVSTNRFKFKGVVPGVSHYDRLAGAIDWLIAAGLVLKTAIVSAAYLPLQAHAKENFFKLYLFDIGVLGAMCNLAPKTVLDYDYGSYKGYFAENYVAQALVCGGEKDLYCWHEKTAEVEFLRIMDGKAIPIEVKAGEVTKSKSLNIYCQKYHPPYQVILSAKPLRIDAQRGLYLLPLYVVDIAEYVEKLDLTDEHRSATGSEFG